MSPRSKRRRTVGSQAGPNLRDLGRPHLLQPECLASNPQGPLPHPTQRDDSCGRTGPYPNGLLQASRAKISDRRVEPQRDARAKSHSSAPEWFDKPARVLCRSRPHQYRAYKILSHQRCRFLISLRNRWQSRSVSSSSICSVVGVIIGLWSPGICSLQIALPVDLARRW
jgi:hypothetical protein